MTKPVILVEGTYGQEELDTVKQGPIWQSIDVYAKQLAEFYEITHSNEKASASFVKNQQDFVDSHVSQSDPLPGNWVYYPWSGVLIHTVKQEQYFALRTNRNQNLITQAEQKVLQDSCIGLIGLSVGSSSAISLAYQGIGGHMKLGEYDILETSNLNRIRARLQDVGQPKLQVVLKQLYEVNPYQHIEQFAEGIDESNIKEFIFGNPKPKVLLEMVDDFALKVTLRQMARQAGIPVIVGANLGDSILFDIERYDTEPNTPIFNGMLGDLPERILNMPDEDKNKYAVEMVGVDNIPPRALSSVNQIGKTLVGRPQLSGTVAINGALSAYFVRRILLGHHLPSGRIKLDFATALQLVEDEL